jgi:hypothetical protein
MGTSIRYCLSFGSKSHFFAGCLIATQETDFVVRPRVDGLLRAVEDVPRQ